MVMFSGLVCVGILTAFGRATGTVLVITGIVMRKMMSNTSMTSTSGVVLMFDITVFSSEPVPTLIDIDQYSRFARCPSGARRRAQARVIHLQIGGDLVAAGRAPPPLSLPMRAPLTR